MINETCISNQNKKMNINHKLYNKKTSQILKTCEVKPIAKS